MQKTEYLNNEKSFLDEIKSIFHNYVRAIIWTQALIKLAKYFAKYHRNQKRGRGSKTPINI